MFSKSVNEAIFCIFPLRYSQGIVYLSICYNIVAPSLNKLKTIYFCVNWQKKNVNKYTKIIWNSKIQINVAET